MLFVVLRVREWGGSMPVAVWERGRVTPRHAIVPRDQVVAAASIAAAHHDIHFRTVVAAHIVGVAVVATVGGHDGGGSERAGGE